MMNEDICVKFGGRIDICHTTVTVVQNLTFGKIQDGGSRHLENT